MNSKGFLEALARRVDFTHEVGERLGHALDGFLLSPHGIGYEWAEPQTPARFGCSEGEIRTLRDPEAEEKSSIAISIKSSCDVSLGIAEWSMNDCGDWEGQDDISVELKLDHEGDVDDSVALILAETMLRGTEFSRRLRSYLHEQLTPGPAHSAAPEPPER